jgi:hypothetical protein
MTSRKGVRIVDLRRTFAAGLLNGQWGAPFERAELGTLLEQEDIVRTAWETDPRHAKGRPETEHNRAPADQSKGARSNGSDHEHTHRSRLRQAG